MMAGAQYSAAIGFASPAKPGRRPREAHDRVVGASPDVGMTRPQAEPLEPNMQASDDSKPFAVAICMGDDARTVADTLGRGLAGSEGQLGVLYATENFAPHLEGMVETLRQHTGKTDWVSAAGYGVIAGGEEHYGEPGAAALLLDLPADGYRFFAGGSKAGAELAANNAKWLSEATMPLALTHVDPRHSEAMQAVDRLAADTGSFLVGGLTAGSGDAPHQAGNASGCLSGVALSPAAIEIATGLSQGCMPLGQAHTVTQGKGNVLIELDGRPALDVFSEDIGEELASDLSQVGGLIFAALPVAGSDTADYTVRNLVAIDPSSKAIAIAATVPEGDRVLFCRRDRESAVEDMRRMTGDLKRRIGNRAPRGGIYISCAARGPNQFATPESETEIIKEVLGDFPMIGFFANGELNRDRIYSYTGVLALFI